LATNKDNKIQLNATQHNAAKQSKAKQSKQRAGMVVVCSAQWTTPMPWMPLHLRRSVTHSLAWLAHARSLTESYYGKPFIQCTLLNYGGQQGIVGSLPAVVNGVEKAMVSKEREGDRALARERARVHTKEPALAHSLPAPALLSLHAIRLTDRPVLSCRITCY
jgi:hypothetical protein